MSRDSAACGIVRRAKSRSLTSAACRGGDRLEPREGVVESEEVVGRLGPGDVHRVEVAPGEVGAAFARPLPPGGLDHDPPHRLGRGAE